MIPTYTKAGREADEYIHGLVTFTVDEIKKAIPHVISVILMGGFGRGEGIVQKTKKGYRPINDFDFYIITKKQYEDEFIENLARGISKKLGFGGLAHAEAFETRRYGFTEFFHIDIRCLPESKLKHLPPLIRYYEMKEAGLVVYGKNSLADFPNITTKDLSLADELRIYMNRMMLMLISIKPEWIKNPKLMTEEEQMILHYYIAKMYLTCAESLLLLSGDFEPTYWGRAKTFGSIYPKKFPALAKQYPNLPKKVWEYLEYKRTLVMPKGNPIDAWFEAQEITQVLFKKTLEELTKKKAPDNLIEQYYFMRKNLAYPYYKDYAKFLLKPYYLNNGLFRWLLARTGMIYLSMKYSFRMHYLHHTPRFKYIRMNDPGITILELMPLMFFSIKRDGSYDKEMTDLLMKELRTLYPALDAETWEDVKLQYLSAQRAYFLMRFV